jgi:hypothetical protein
VSSTSVTEHASRRLASVAAEYENRGYKVRLQPAAADVPEFLGGFEPDLIAIGNGESVVVEVKAGKELFETQQSITAMEAAVRGRPGWRFELVIDGSNPELGRSLAAPQIETSIKEANELQRGGHVVAALLLLWSRPRESCDFWQRARMSIWSLQRLDM